MPPDVDGYIVELHHAVIAASQNYEIWLVYNEERSKFVEAMNNYTVFFETSIHAHFAAMLIALYRLSENGDKKYSIPSVLSALRRDSSFDRAALDQLNAMYDGMKPLWRKVNILRNNVFGHRLRSLTIKEAFQKADVSPNNLGDLIEGTKKLLNVLSNAWNRTTYAFDLDAKEDAIRLLKDIDGLRSSRLHGSGP